MSKSDLYLKEQEKLKEIFKDVDEGKKQLVEGLIEEAAFLYAENYKLREIMEKTGMLKVHPTNLELQKQTEAGKQYLKNINSYAVVIKTLNGVLQKNTIEAEDAFDAWVKKRMAENEE